MPVENYPPDILHTDFHDPAGLYGVRPSPTAWLSEHVFARGRTDAVLGINHLVIPGRGPAAVWLHTPNGDSVSHHTPHAGAQHLGICMVPFVENNVEIRWRFQNPHNLRKAKLELFCREERQPLWTHQWKRRDVLVGRHRQPGGWALLFQNAGATWDGSMLWDGTFPVPPGRQAEFPDGCICVTHSPYKLKLTAGGSNGHTEEAWTYIHVKVHDLRLRWGEPEMIDDNRRVVPESRKAEVVAAERKLLSKLPADESGYVDDSHPHTITLKSIAFCPSIERLSSTDNAFELYKGLWGDGPRLPLLAELRVTDSGGNPQQEGRALGNLKVLWDWTSDPERPRLGELNLEDRVEEFLAEALEYRIGEDAPDGSDNCHVDRGGKRGTGAPPVFPAQDGQDDFPYRVEPCVRRPWSAFSHVLRTGEGASSTGVIFQPSRMAKDTFKVSAYLAYQRDPNGGYYLDNRISAADIGQEITHNPRPLPHASTQVFTIERRVDMVRYVTKHGEPLLDLQELPPFFAPAGLALRVPADVTGMSAEDYNDAFAQSTQGYKRFVGGYTDIWDLAIPAEQFASESGEGPSLWALTYAPWNKTQMANKLRGVTDESSYRLYCSEKWTGEMLPKLLAYYRAEHFPGEAGLVLFHFLGADNYDNVSGAAVFEGDGGISTDKGTAHVSFQEGIEDVKPLLNLAAHELGHTLNLVHAVSHRGMEVPGAVRRCHDNRFSCVMNYDVDGLHFCAMCVLTLRGWNTRNVNPESGSGA